MTSRMLMVIAIGVVSRVAWAGPLSEQTVSRAQSIVRAHDDRVAAETRARCELGKAVKTMKKLVKRMRKATNESGAVIAGDEKRIAVVYPTKLEKREFDGKTWKTMKVLAEEPFSLQRAVTIGRKLREEFPGTTAKSAEERFARFLAEQEGRTGPRVGPGSWGN